MGLGGLFWVVLSIGTAAGLGGQGLLYSEMAAWQPAGLPACLPAYFIFMLGCLVGWLRGYRAAWLDGCLRGWVAQVNTWLGAWLDERPAG